MVLPAGFAPATVSFEASRADLLRYGSLKRFAHGPRSRTPTFLLQKACRLFGRWPGVEGSTRTLGENGCPTWSPADGSTPRFTVSETVVLRSRERVARQGRCCAW